MINCSLSEIWGLFRFYVELRIWTVKLQEYTIELWWVHIRMMHNENIRIKGTGIDLGYV